MDKIYEKFLAFLEKEDKEGAVSYALEKLEHNEISIVDLYTKILAPSLNNMECNEKDKEVCIWREHVRSSIIRTIVECCYPYILKQKKRENKDLEKKVVVVCPPEEYHDIGARIASDFFTLCGYDSVFVGSNTPKEEFLNAINIVRPKYIVISVTNYYNLVNAKEIVENIRDKSSYDIKILVGGYAFKVNPKAYETIGADMLIDSFEDVEKLTNVKWKVESESDI